MAQTSSLSLCVSLFLPIHMHTGVHMHIIHYLSALYQPQQQERGYSVVHDYQWTGQTKLIKVPS